MGQRRNFSKEFKLEAVNLVVTRGVSVARACRDLDVSENVMKRWIREFHSSEGQAFPGHGVQKPNDAELTRLRREVAKLKMERDILKKAAAIERFFSTLKIERVNRRGIYKTRKEAKADVLDYIECFYNPKRGHSTIGCVSPAVFESVQYA